MLEDKNKDKSVYRIFMYPGFSIVNHVDDLRGLTLPLQFLSVDFLLFVPLLLEVNLNCHSSVAFSCYLSFWKKPQSR
jgi:hypothetical protein